MDVSEVKGLSKLLKASAILILLMLLLASCAPLGSKCSCGEPVNSEKANFNG